MSENIPNTDQVTDGRRVGSLDSDSGTDSEKSVVFTAPASECGTDNTSEFPSVYDQPSDFECLFYYDAFPTSPQLVGRTSCWSTPWVHNVHDDIPDGSPLLRQFRRNLRRLTRVAPVGPHHPIHRTWAASTGPKILKALSTMHWSSVDVLRMSVPTEQGAAAPPNQWPVIVWIALEDAAEKGLTGHYSYRHQWLVIDNLLQRVRRILDADGLRDVECEIREAHVAQTKGPGQEPGPEPSPEPCQEPNPEQNLAPSPDRHVRPLSPSQAGWELSVAAALLICPGTRIRHDVAGRDDCAIAITLGLYVAPDVENIETEASSSSSDPSSSSNPSTDQTLWALTCGHTLKHHEGTTGIRAPTMLSLNKAYSHSGFRNHRAVMEKICAEPSDKRDYQLWLLGVIENYKKWGTKQRTFGQVQRKNAPPVGVVKMAETAPSAASSSSSSPSMPPPSAPSTFTRDWALIDIKRNYLNPASVFNILPMELTIPRLKGIQRLARRVLQNPTFAFPQNGNLRLKPGRGPEAIIPLAEQFGPFGPFGANKPPITLVAKRGGRSNCTLGIPLDIGSYVRDGMGVQERQGPDSNDSDVNNTQVSVEWAIVHARATINRGRKKSRIGGFSMEADSGAAVFDMSGRVGGILTTASYGYAYKGRFDISYATPMEHVLRDIEETVGTKVKIV